MVRRVLQRVYAHPRNIMITLLIAALTLSGLLLLPNQTVLMQVLLSPDVAFSAKVSFWISLYGTLGTNFTLFTASYTVTIALLFGINSTLLWYYIRHSRKLSRSDRTVTFTGVGGFVSGLFGIGCAACGTILLAGIFKLLGITWILTYLPLHGAEFGVVGVLLLGITAYIFSKRIDDPLVCPID